MHRAPVRWSHLGHDSRKLNTRDPSNRWHVACDSYIVMKTIRSISPVKSVLLALLGASDPLVTAQTTDTSTGTILDSNAAPSVTSPENPASTKLTATILPIEKNATTKGETTFVMVGSAVSVVGRITGMEPDKRYQAVVWVPSVPAPSKQGDTVVNPSSEARPPAADSPPTAATVTNSSPQPTELDLGTLVPDASGGANLNATLQNKDLTAPPTGILGGFIVIKRAPPLDETDERSPVASGVIGEPIPATEDPGP